MCRIKLKAQGFALLALFTVLCMSIGTVGAADELTWPIQPDLMTPDGDVAGMWTDVGDVAIWNDRVNVYIDIVPADGLKLKEVAIHYVDDPAEFKAVLDKKTNAPKIPSLDYRTDYLQDYGSLADRHSQVIAIADLETFDGEWCPDPEQCPPYRYFIVQAVLQQLVDDQWVDLPEDAYARNQGVFDRFPPEAAVAVGDAKYWGYVTYPRAKPEPGHFVDANVNGLGYVTVTQSGTTGDNGQFWYLPGERVAFSVGSLYLGDALGDRSVAPTDLFGVVELADDRVLNVARLLQSLDADGVRGHGAINITEPVIECLESALNGAMPDPDDFFADDTAVGNLIDATVDCAGLVAVTKEEALENLNSGMMAGNLMKRNVSKNADMRSDKAQIEILPVYVPAKKSDGSLTEVTYYDENGEVLDIPGNPRNVAKPILVSYVEEVEDTNGAMDVFIALSRDDGDTWKRRNISRTADKSSLLGYPGTSWKPQMKVMDNLIFVAWSDKYCRGGRPGYAITVCPDTDGDGINDPCEICRDTAEGENCYTDYPGDDDYWQDDLYGVAGPQRSVSYDDHPELGEVPYSCVWTARGVMDTATGDIQWFKPERVTSGRRDAFQIMVNGGDDVAFAMVWQEDPKGLRSGEGDGPGDGWSGSNTYNKTDIWYSYITAADFGKIDPDYPEGGFGDNNDDLVGTDTELAGRVKALVPMSLPVRISDNEICSLQNILAEGGGEESEHDGEGKGTHRFCGTLEGIGTEDEPGTNPRCAYTVEKANPKGEIHDVCVTADGRLLDGNTGASRPNINVQPYNAGASAWVIVGYEESKGVGIPPDGENDDEGCGGEETGDTVDEHETRYKPDMGKNVIYHSFDLFNPDEFSGGGIVNLPETDEYGNLVYLVDEDGNDLLDWKGDKQLAYENARRVRFLPQSPTKAKNSSGKTSVVILYRQGEEGSGKPADIFMRRAVYSTGNPYKFINIEEGAQNLSSVTPTEFFQDPFDADKPLKMLRWTWSPANLADSSAANPHTDAHAHRGALNGDDLIIAYTLTPNWGRRGNDKYDLYIRRSFDGGQSWTTDPNDPEPIKHNVVFRVPIIDYEARTVTWEEEVVTTEYERFSQVKEDGSTVWVGATEPPRNVSNLRNNRISVMEPRLVKTPGTITSDYNFPEDKNIPDIYQIAYGTEFNQNQLPDDVVYPQIPLDIYYGRTLDKGQHFEGVLVTPQDGSGKPEEGWNSLANDHPSQGAPQIRQTPDGSRLYGIWLEESSEGSDVMFRRVDYRGASQ